MAEKAGTLWENISDTAGCNHGFASYVLYWLEQLEKGSIITVGVRFNEPNSYYRTL